MSKRLTIEDIYDPEKKINFDGTTYSDTIWLDDAHFLLRKTDPRAGQADWLKISLATGSTTAFYNPELLQQALTRLDDITEDQAARLARQPNYVLSPDRSALLLNHANDLFYYRLDSDVVIRLTSTPSPETCEEFSPDGKLISFVRDNNLWLLNLETRQEWGLTKNGNDTMLNGRLDWVYQEEIYGRDNFKGYWWSPDSHKIAYLQLDESALKPFPVTDHLPLQPKVETTNYPLAGTPNPTVRLGIVDALGGETTWVDYSRYSSTDFLVVRVGWTPDSANVVHQVQNRNQQWLDLNVGNRTIFREQRDTWVSATNEPKWLRDGSFLWLSEHTGWSHIFRYSIDGKLIDQITDGPWEVRSLLGVDQERRLIYFSGTRNSHTANQTYRVDIDSRNVERITKADGTHSSILNPSTTHFVDSWSDVNTPTQLRLHSSDGTIVRVIDENRVDALQQFTLVKTEFFQVQTKDGFVLEASMLKPADFDPSRRYPVLVYVYGGPHHPQVVNAWGGEKQLWHRLVAQMGYIVWTCDNRTASGKGAVSSWPLYRRTGELELRDIEESIQWLKSQPYIDGTRIGLWGWSYGGYMTLYALTHSTTFKIGIAGAPVTDWRNYDSVYTERYMDTPQSNPDGYENSSVVKSAANLSGKLLLVHGSTDDNVHLQNTMQFVYELQKAGKQFDLMIYPLTRHAVTDPSLLKHLRSLMTEFVVENL